MGYLQDENGVKHLLFWKTIQVKYSENKDVLDVEDNVGHRETRRDFLLLFSKKS
jgi:Ran GTPase-activating protein (RanGAP) involved in mRNA processing and transport